MFLYWIQEFFLIDLNERMSGKTHSRFCKKKVILNYAIYVLLYR